MTTQPRPRVVGYIRVSTVEQAREGVSLDAQRSKLTAFCTAMDLDLVEVHVDAGASAKSLRKRPGLSAALADLEEGRAGGLVVTKLDRLTRSVVDLGHLLERYFTTRFELTSIGDSLDTRSAAGRLVLNVLGSVSQWEREAIGERTREGLAELKAQGVRLGGVALGWKRTAEVDGDGRKVWAVDPEELATAERIRSLRAAGASLRLICETLDAEGRPTKRGGRWAPQTVSQVLSRMAA